MKTKYITSIKYYIRPRMKKRWFSKDITVFDLIKYSEGEKWIDPSYGNGGGDFVEFESEEVLYSFNTFMEADNFKIELENSCKN